MSSIPPSSTYRDYKRNTTFIATWLASTAQANGFPSQQLSQPAEPLNTRRRQKGRARKEAKEKAAKEAASLNNQSPPAAPRRRRYILLTKHFITLAEFIVKSSNGPTVVIPNCIVSTLNRVIDARTRHAQQLSRCTSEADSVADKNHQHFIKVLRDVRCILVRHMSSTNRKVTPPNPMDSQKQAVETDPLDRFADLEREVKEEENAPSESLLYNEEPDQQDQTGNSILYEVDTDKSYEEASFALRLLMRDLTRIRNVVGMIWQKQGLGLSDLAACAVTTNEAILLARGLIDEIEPLCEHHGGTIKMLENMLLETCVRDGLITEAQISSIHDSEETARRFLLEAYDVADGFCLNACIFLQSWVQLFTAGQDLLPTQDMAEIPLKGDRGCMTREQKHRRDQVLLSEIFAHYIMISNNACSYVQVEDATLCGVDDLKRMNKVPFFLAFAAQLHLDIHHSLGPATFGFVQHALDQVKGLMADLTLYKDLHKDSQLLNKPDNTGATMIKMIEVLLGQGQMLINDPLHERKLEMLQLAGEAPSPFMEPNRGLAFSPILAGLTLYTFRHQVHQTGLQLSNVWSVTQSTAQLYHTLKREGLLGGHTWEDMEVALKIIKRSSFFAGHPPVSLARDRNNFLLCNGVPLTALMSSTTARGQRAVDRIPLNKARSLEHHLPVSQALVARFLDRDRHQILSVEDFCNLVTGCNSASTKDNVLSLLSFDSATGNKFDIDMDKIRELWDTKPNQRKGQPKQVPKLRADELVYVLNAQPQAEAVEMAFPLLRLHTTCWNLLQRAKELCYPLLAQTFGKAELDESFRSEQSLVLIVQYIFEAASGFEGMPDRGPLEAAGKVFRDYSDEWRR